MFGLEKENEGKFVFDLERDIKEQPGYGKKILGQVENRISEIKKALREGANEKEYDRLGILLHGYNSLQRVLKRVK